MSSKTEQGTRSQHERHGRFLGAMSVVLILFGALTFAYGLFSMATVDTMLADNEVLEIYIFDMGIAVESLEQIMYSNMA